MVNYMERINKLAEIAGYSVNPIDRAPLTILENEVANLRADLAAKQKALTAVTEELEKSKLELGALSEMEQDIEADIKKELTNNELKVGILRTYIDTIENKDDFLLNKVTKEVELHNQTFYAKLKEVHGRASEVNQDFEAMRSLQNECDELRKAVE